MLQIVRVLTVIMLASSATIIMWPTAVIAEPFFSGCSETIDVPSGWGDSSYYDDAVVLHYWVADDFRDDLASCSFLNSFVTQDEVENRIRAAAEIWNLEARGPNLRYAGRFDGDVSSSSLCSSVPDSPAIFIRFKRGCAWNGSSCTSAIASVNEISGCSDAIEVEVYGDTTGGGLPEGGGCNGDAINWALGRGAGVDFMNTMVHEFGHTLDLGHPDPGVPDPPTPAVPAGGSVMLASGAPSDGTHLMYYEKDCVDEQFGGRFGWLKARSIDHWGYWSSVQHLGYGTNKGGRFGNAWRDCSTCVANDYAIMVQDSDGWNLHGDFSSLTWGWLSFSPTSYDWSPNPLNHGAFVYGSPDYVTGMFQRLFYNWAGSTGIVDPPNMKQVTSTNWWASKSYTQLQSCASGSCANMSSSIPISAAYDPISEQSIFLAVNTIRGGSNHGEIRIYPGHYTPGSNPHRLQRGDYLSDVLYLPADDHPTFSHSGKTYVAPAIACADERVFGNYNCVVAWQDRGIPQGSILYALFTVNPNDDDDILWAANSWELPGATSVSHLSMAYTASHGKFWITWLDADDSFAEVRYSSNDGSCTTCWTSPSGVGSGGTGVHVTEPPQFIYDNQNSLYNGGIVWAEIAY